MVDSCCLGTPPFCKALLQNYFPFSHSSSSSSRSLFLMSSSNRPSSSNPSSSTSHHPPPSLLVFSGSILSPSPSISFHFCFNCLLKKNKVCVGYITKIGQFWYGFVFSQLFWTFLGWAKPHQLEIIIIDNWASLLTCP